MQECFDLNGRKEKIPLSPPPPLSGGFPLLLQKVAKIIIPFIFPLSEPDQPSSINLILLPTTLGGGHFQKRTSSPSGQHRMHTRLPDQPSRSLIRPNGDGRRTAAGGTKENGTEPTETSDGWSAVRTCSAHNTREIGLKLRFSIIALSLSLSLRGSGVTRLITLFSAAFTHKKGVVCACVEQPPPFFCSLRREIQAMEKTPASGPRDPESVAVQNFRNIMCLTHISRESKVLSDA